MSGYQERLTKALERAYGSDGVPSHVDVEMGEQMWVLLREAGLYVSSMGWRLEAPPRLTTLRLRPSPDPGRCEVVARTATTCRIDER